MSNSLEIILIDDEAIVGNRLKPALDKIGCSVEVFQNPKEAMSRIEEKEFNIVVTDIRMDEIDGMQVLEYVRGRYPKTKIIMISGYAKMDVAREAMEKGAFDIIAKPFKPDDLRRSIANAAESLGMPLAVKSN